MEKLIRDIKRLMGTNVKDKIDSRIKEFNITGRKDNFTLFKELCFCILTANFNAEKSIRIQREIDNGFLLLSEEKLVDKLQKNGHRYPKSRAKYIVEARRYKNVLKKIIESSRDEYDLREWLVRNIKGIGYKEASHFLRNIGFKNIAIVDFHIIDLLSRYNLIEKPKYLSKNIYFQIEKLLRKIAKKTGVSLAELDLYMWYMETGKILK
ncbi:MAG: N-glycosylase/DNA lyase [Thermoplasmata archaeon]|nr:N-glycosylase/DNA lyase [Thermoplasmata archaeon]